MWKDDTAVARAVLDHIAAGTTDAGTEVWQEPVEHYTQPDRLAAEIAALRRRWVVLGPAVVVAEPTGFAALDVLGVPLLAVRDRDGRLRVFRNACRHRGMQVATGTGCARSLVCGYHGWTYALDGRLRHVPHDGAFPDLDRDTRGLVEVPAVEQDGLMLVRLDAEGSDAEEPAPGPWSGLVDGDGLTYAGTADVVEPVNWKILTETFLEGLHIAFLHRDTFFPVQYDDLNVVELDGPYSRVTFPYRNVERLADRDPSTWQVGHRITFVHSLFPNAIVATFPDQHLLFVLEPEAVDRTRLVTYRFVKGAAPSAPPSSPPAGGPETLLGQGGDEDFIAARSIQRGLAAGANQVLTFGLHESAIVHFHRHLDAAIEEGAPA